MIWIHLYYIQSTWTQAWTQILWSIQKVNIYDYPYISDNASIRTKITHSIHWLQCSHTTPTCIHINVANQSCFIWYFILFFLWFERFTPSLLISRILRDKNLQIDGPLLNWFRTFLYQHTGSREGYWSHLRGLNRDSSQVVRSMYMSLFFALASFQNLQWLKSYLLCLYFHHWLFIGLQAHNLFNKKNLDQKLSP